MNINDTIIVPKEANPFVNEYFIVKVKVKTDFKDNILIGNEFLPKETVYEGDPYIKKFRSAQIRDAILTLLPATAKLWTWIEYELPHGQDYLDINPDRFCKKANVTRRTYTTAVRQLKENSFICSSSVQDVVFINPRLVFYGSRLTKYPSHLKRI